MNQLAHPRLQAAVKVAASPSGAILLIVLFAFAIRVYQLDYNSAFQDEAVYIVIGQHVFAGTWGELNPFAWVGGLPLFYPPLTAAFGIFGVVGARFLNVLLGTTAVYLMYRYTSTLKLVASPRANIWLALIAAAFLAVLTIPIYLSRLAIYDMLSFTLFLAGLYLMQRGLTIKQPDLWQRENRLFAGAVIIFLSFLAKYITLVLFPPLILAAYAKTWRLPSTRQQITKYFTIPLLVLTGAYIALNFQALWEFNRDQVSETTRVTSAIITQFLRYTAVPLIAAVVALALARVRERLTIITLLLLALVIPAIHLLQNSIDAVHQHVFLSLIFLLPLSAYLLVRLIQRHWHLGIICTVSTLAIAALFSQPQVRALETQWPDSRTALAHLAHIATPNDTIFTIEHDATILALPQLPENQIIGPYYFEYQDLSGRPAYQAAINAGHFNIILLHHQAEGTTTPVSTEHLTARYVLVYNNADYQIYRRQQ